MAIHLSSAAQRPAIFLTACRQAIRAAILCGLFLHAGVALATSNYEYGADEYVTIEKGMSPDGKYAITAHGGGDDGYDHFHIYLTNAVSGKKIGPLEEIGQFLDTGADAYCAKWSKDSQQVTIIYRIDRHEPLKVFSYHIGNGRATLIKGPVDATKEQTDYWAKQCGGQTAPSEKVFGHPKGN